MPYNSYRILRPIMIVLAALGLIVAAYLTIVHLTDTEVLCSGIGGCDTVQKSRYSEVAGIPVALIGLVGYLAILGVLAAEEAVAALTEYGPIIVFGLSLMGVLYSIYLTYLELFVIKAVCPYCVASAVIMTMIFGMSLYRLFWDGMLQSEAEQTS